MGLLNDQNVSNNLVKKVQKDDQTNSSTALTNPPVESIVEDVELNEEQLDIISGGGDGLIRG